MQLQLQHAVAGLALLVPNVVALLRFSCSQLVTERLDPLVNPGVTGSPHLHQVIGGNAFRPLMDLKSLDIPSAATCTTCTFADDFSNYWTAVLYFQARNGTFKRVPQKPNAGFESAKGGMTVYYTPVISGTGKVTAFKPGFRMIVGNPNNRNANNVPRQLTFTCLKDIYTRTGETKEFPKQPCPAGIMVNVRFPTCWDGVTLDPPDHASHVAYPSSGTFESNGPCPATHPVKIPQLFYEVIWDTTAFNNKAEWPADGSQPFVWSFGDKSGYGNHGDYVFGWKGDALQKAMDTNCYINCPQLKTQSIQQGNQCSVKDTVGEQIDGWLTELPGGMPVDK
ncbi:hypothetical protein F5B22DRAFT_632646 [Xylaria bambusicola]|uniref:uncharacterized protein n=1 Tax=Xylaria bambusicola TaxID=326684 RepID=UPI0020080A29|nr:uncharacterized protein F5B22DRAFT_632646 [Xylaria bambusicola]KAI0528216.1 hypothetical protein F5B22DRAFT_632646 [Xylaria bambusicola]